MLSRKKILNIEEEVKLYLPNNKFIRRLAKIDTGAHFTSIDLSLGKKLGYKKSLDIFYQNIPKFKITKNNFRSIRKQIKTKYKPALIKKCPDLVDIQLIPATNGFSIRPYFNIEFKLKNQRIKTKAAFVDRSHLGFLVLVGREDMKKFLIDPAINNYNTFTQI